MTELKAHNINDFSLNDIVNCEFYLKSDVDKVIEELEAENERLEKFADELIKDCKWLCTNHTPAKNGFETIVLCTNGKKRVAKFRAFDSRWYDVNNGNKLNVVKWLWQPRMPSDEKKYNDELRHHKYKRCVTMAESCLHKSWYYYGTHRKDSARKMWKWRRRWLKLAEKINPNKLTA